MCTNLFYASCIVQFRSNSILVTLYVNYSIYDKNDIVNNWFLIWVHLVYIYTQYIYTSTVWISHTRALTHTYIHIYIHTQTHTYTYTYTHILA